MKVSAITVYPVKSLGGVDLPASRITWRGLEHDRRYMLADSDGMFITQRQAPALSRLRVEEIAGGWRIESPSEGTIEIPLTPNASSHACVRVWRDVLEGCVEADASLGRWFSQFTRMPTRLVYMPNEVTRNVDTDYATDAIVSFADGYPILITSTSSLQALNDRLEQPVGMSRFRPNIVVDAPVPWAEDEWSAITIGRTPFDVSKPCARCVMTTIDPDTGTKDTRAEPLRTLSEFRTTNGKVLFGQCLVPTQLGVVECGADVKVETSKPSAFVEAV